MLFFQWPRIYTTPISLKPELIYTFLALRSGPIPKRSSRYFLKRCYPLFQEDYALRNTMVTDSLGLAEILTRSPVISRKTCVFRYGGHRVALPAGVLDLRPSLCLSRHAVPGSSRSFICVKLTKHRLPRWRFYAQLEPVRSSHRQHKQGRQRLLLFVAVCFLFKAPAEAAV